MEWFYQVPPGNDVLVRTAPVPWRVEGEARRCEKGPPKYSSTRQSSAHRTDGMDSNDQVAVEDYRQGYPRFSALVALDDAFTAFRRFNRLRVRLLLLRQDKITLLEKRLDAIDGQEPCPLFLGCRRMDRNTEREAVISEIENALAGYGTYSAVPVQIDPFLTPSSGRRCVDTTKQSNIGV